MTLKDVIERMAGPDRIKIATEDGELIYIGYQGTLQLMKGQQIEFKSRDGIDMDAEVVRIGLFLEIFRKENRKEVLASTEGDIPVPDMITDISFGDLEECIYTKIIVKK